MNTAPQTQSEAESQYGGILARTTSALRIAQAAATGLADALAGQTETALRAVEEAEKELDVLDREVDTSAASAIALATPAQANEILTCAKMIVDLERIGDLALSAASCACALGHRLKMEDVRELLKMASLLERMLINVQRAFAGREAEAAVAVLRADADMDRLRNLMMIRHLEEAPSRLTQDSVQILFMAQSLERAGDHVKNVAEEVCHMVTGQSIRHALRRQSKQSSEQMYLKWLREQHKPSQESENSRELASQ